MSSPGAATLRAGSVQHVRPRGRATVRLLGLLTLLVVALAVRLSLLIRSSWLLEGDDAL